MFALLTVHSFSSYTKKLKQIQPKNIKIKVFTDTKAIYPFWLILEYEYKNIKKIKILTAEPTLDGKDCTPILPDFHARSISPSPEFQDAKYNTGHRIVSDHIQTSFTLKKI